MTHSPQGRGRSTEGNSPRAAQLPLELMKECVPEIEAATVPIGGVQEEQFVHDRTGVLYRVGDQHFVLTASHAPSKNRDDLDLRAIIENNVPLYVSVNNTNVRPIPLIEARFYGSEVDGRAVAAIRIPDDATTQLSCHKRFVLHNEIALNDDERSGYYVVAGFPTEWSHAHNSKLFSHLCRQYRGDLDSDTGYLPDLHIVLAVNRNS